MKEGDKVKDCYLGGAGELSDMWCIGTIEAIGGDFTLVRNDETNKLILVSHQLTEEDCN